MINPMFPQLFGKLVDEFIQRYELDESGINYDNAKRNPGYRQENGYELCAGRPKSHFIGRHVDSTQPT